MGDSGALLLGFVLAAVSVQGLLKTAALATLVLPLLVLAVPIARHVVRGRPAAQARRSRSTSATGRTCTTASSAVGFSQRARRRLPLRPGASRSRGAALATRFVPSAPARRLALWPTLGDRAASPLLAIGGSVYIVYLLEIVKLANPFIRRREETRADERRRSPDRGRTRDVRK